ncbi:MAG: amino acid permease, partial [Mycoplasma sp.]|nr:amino acid permease [Mycoplasma sp.]
MKEKNARKLGFFSALAMLVGTVVGIGIFFKNGNILAENNNNAIGTLMSWIIGGLVSLFAAISFSEIGSMKTKHSGLAAWAGKIMNKKNGYFIRFNYTFFYFGALTIILGLFASESLINIFVILANV